MHPLTAIELRHRTVDEERRDALVVAARKPAETSEPGRRRRIRLARRRLRTA